LRDRERRLAHDGLRESKGTPKGGAPRKASWNAICSNASRERRAPCPALRGTRQRLRRAQTPETTMATTASDIMDRHLLDASQADSILELLHEMDDRGLDSTPVLDAAGKPIGVVRVREVESCH